MGLVWSHKT